MGEFNTYFIEVKAKLVSNINRSYRNGIYKRRFTQNFKPESMFLSKINSDVR